MTFETLDPSLHACPAPSSESNPKLFVHVLPTIRAELSYHQVDRIATTDQDRLDVVARVPEDLGRAGVSRGAIADTKRYQLLP